mmetsp:Transcript_23289/g.22870  ORF Transcript_23289/g.22870 Transcript_23289/m.22870 type:complete len:121 (-) Transcript_23289:1228-1590(-)
MLRDFDKILHPLLAFCVRFKIARVQVYILRELHHDGLIGKKLSDLGRLRGVLYQTAQFLSELSEGIRLLFKAFFIRTVVGYYLILVLLVLRYDSLVGISFILLVKYQLAGVVHRLGLSLI